MLWYPVPASIDSVTLTFSGDGAYLGRDCVSGICLTGLLFMTWLVYCSFNCACLAWASISEGCMLFVSTFSVYFFA